MWTLCIWLRHEGLMTLNISMRRPGLRMCCLTTLSLYKPHSREYLVRHICLKNVLVSGFPTVSCPLNMRGNVSLTGTTGKFYPVTTLYNVAMSQF